MPKCNMCGDTGIVHVIDADPPYRPCPYCTPKSSEIQKQIKKKETNTSLNFHREYENKELQKKRIKRKVKRITTLLSILSIVLIFGELIYDNEQNVGKALIFLGVWLGAMIIIGLYFRMKYNMWV